MFVLPVLQAVDQIMAPVYNQFDVQCRACPHDNVCCNTLVALTYLEACDIVEYLEETDQWKALRAKIKKQRDDYARTGNFLADIGKDWDKKVAWKWFLRQQKCAFYDTEKHRCRIYPVRPLSCRELFAHLGTRCDLGNSQTTTLAHDHGMALLRLNWDLHHDKEKLAGELTTFVWQAWQERHREKKHA